MQSIRRLRDCAPFFLGIFGCSLASAADGAASTTHGALAVGRAVSPVPASYPADAPPPHKPLQEAFDACKSLSEGDACSVNFNGHSMTGTCRKGPQGESELACVPAHPPGPPASGSNQMLTGSAMERELDQLEREIRGS